jgi:hypothetical protein
LLDVPSGIQDSPNAGAFSWGRTLYIAGATYPENFATGDAFVARTSTGGVIDPRFRDGIVSEHLDLEYTVFTDLVSMPASVTVVGWNFSEANETLPLSDALIARYRHNGSLDYSFGDSGMVLLDFMQGEPACGPRVEVE